MRYTSKVVTGRGFWTISMSTPVCYCLMEEPTISLERSAFDLDAKRNGALLNIQIVQQIARKALVFVA